MLQIEHFDEYPQKSELDHLGLSHHLPQPMPDGIWAPLSLWEVAVHPLLSTSLMLEPIVVQDASRGKYCTPTQQASTTTE